MDNCCLCNNPIDKENAPILSMSGGGYPRYLCDGCAELLDRATMGKDPEDIAEALGEIGELMTKNDPDGVTYAAISELVVDAGVRGKLIKEGRYDFSKDEEEHDDGLEDIPEELLESEEDKKKNEEEAAKQKQFDKFYNYFLIGTCIGVGLFIIWKLIDTFILK